MKAGPKKNSIFFEKTGLIFYTHRFKTILAFVFLTILTFQTFKSLRMDVSIEGFLKKDDPVLSDYYQFRRDFDNDELIVVGIGGDQVFEMEFLKKLKQLHDELEAGVPYIDEITSLINVRHTRGENETLIVEDLFNRFPENNREVEILRKRTAENAFYKNLIISKDLKITAIVIRLLSFSPQFENDLMQGFETNSPARLERLTVPECGKAVKKTQEIIRKYNGKNFKVHLSGTAAVDHFLVNIIPRDTKKFLLLTYLAVIILLAVIFRRVSGVLFPVVIVSLTLVYTLALFSLFKVAVKLPTQTLPSFLLAVSVCYCVHILALFYYSFDKGVKKKQAVAQALAHSGKAILLTGITTAVGLFSFSGSKNAPIGELGLFAGSGVFIAVLLTFTLLPCLLSFIPEKKVSRKPSLKYSFLDHCLKKIARFATEKSMWVIAFTFLILLACVPEFKKIEFSHNTLKWLPETAAIRTDTEFLDERLKGTVSMEIIIDTKKENGLYDPKLLKRIDRVSKRIEAFSTEKVTTGKAWSLTEILKETNKALHSNNDNYYKIPEERDLCAQELFLFSNSGSDDLEDFTDSGFSKARLRVKLPFLDAIAYHEYIKKVNTLLKEEFPDVSVTTTGLIMIYARVIANTIEDMKTSYLIAVLAVTILMIFLIGDIRMGLISMVPNLFPIIVIIGIAGFLKIPFSLFIMLIGNIVIGLAVDDTIHFMHNFNTYLNQGHSCEESVEKTLLTSGRAMLLTSLILACAFFIYLFSSLNHLNHFGVLSGLAVILALGADFFITPALMTIFYSKKVSSSPGEKTAVKVRQTENV